MTFFLNLLYAGLVSGAIYGMFALCICMMFRVSMVLNLAIGDFAMLGALGTNLLVSEHHLSVALAIVVVVVVIAVAAFAYDRIVLRFALDGERAREGIFVVFFFTLALSFFIEGIGGSIFGTNVYSAPTLWNGPVLTILGAHVERSGLLVLATAVVVGAVLVLYLRLRLTGKALTACGDNAFGARVVAIKPSSLRLKVFVATAVLAALFGIVESSLSGMTNTSGAALSFSGLAAASLAALTSPGRAVVAGLSIGIAESLIGGYITTQYQTAVLYGILVVLFVSRPQLLAAAATEGAGNS
jgi:branched-chain amino acid transport system permease protein